MAGWFYRKVGLLDEVTEGPLSDSEITSLCRAAKIDRSALASHKHFTSGQWMAIGSIPEMVRHFDKGDRDRELERQRIEQDREAEKARLAMEREQRRIDQQRVNEAMRDEERRRQMATMVAQRQALPPAPMHHQQPAYPMQPVVAIHQQQQSQALAAVANVFMPGLGQLIQGRLIDALAFFLLYCMAVVSIVILIGFIAAPAVWIWSIVDAANHRPA
jgi:TM2 domain-containing membrane protein YozV